MKEFPIAPRVHVFACANRRDPSSPLGPGCGEVGESVFDALKAAVQARGAHRSLWVTKTHCLGVCPKQGAAVAVYPRGAILSDVRASDATAIVEATLTALRESP